MKRYDAETNHRLNEARRTVLTEQVLIGACCACQRAAGLCGFTGVGNGRTLCAGFVADRGRIAAILADDASGRQTAPWFVPEKTTINTQMSGSEAQALKPHQSALEAI